MKDYSSLTITPDQAVLLIIDIQERLAPVIEGQEDLIGKTAVLVQIADTLHLPIFVTEQYPKGLGPTVAPLKTVLDAATVPVQIHEKITFNALTPEVAAALADSGRKQVIIAGMETHICVFQTTRALQAAGYQVFLAQDAVGSRTTVNKQNGLQLMAACGATISNVETLLYDLLQQAGTPQFKTLSKLIK